MFITNKGELSFDPNSSQIDLITSSVLISLFTWQGTWFVRNIGTKFNIAFRMKLTEDNKRELIASAEESLQWLIEDGLVESFSVRIQDQKQTEAEAIGFYGLQISINLLDKTSHYINFNL